MCIQITACESDGQVIRITGADVFAELWLVNGGRAIAKYESESDVPQKWCFAERPCRKARRHSETATVVGPAKEHVVGEAHVVLSAGNAGSACLVYRHRSVGSAEHIGAANRHQSATSKHQSTYIHDKILNF